MTGAPKVFITNFIVILQYDRCTATQSLTNAVFAFKFQVKFYKGLTKHFDPQEKLENRQKDFWATLQCRGDGQVDESKSSQVLIDLKKVQAHCNQVKIKCMFKFD